MRFRYKNICLQKVCVTAAMFFSSMGIAEASSMADIDRENYMNILGLAYVCNLGWVEAENLFGNDPVIYPAFKRQCGWQAMGDHLESVARNVMDAAAKGIEYVYDHPIGLALGYGGIFIRKFMEESQLFPDAPDLSDKVAAATEIAATGIVATGISKTLAGKAALAAKNAGDSFVAPVKWVGTATKSYVVPAFKWVGAKGAEAIIAHPVGAAVALLAAGVVIARTYDKTYEYFTDDSGVISMNTSCGEAYDLYNLKTPKSDFTFARKYKHEIDTLLNRTDPKGVFRNHLEACAEKVNF
jgi:hypothetical protein